MTIIVGILCNKGCVIASDGMASNNLGTTPFVGIENTKIHLVKNELLVSCAGEDNLMTLFINFLENNYLSLKKTHESSAIDLANSIGAGFAHTIIDLYNKYPTELGTHYLGLIKQRGGLEFGAIIAFAFQGSHYMFGYNGSLVPSMVRDNGIWHSIIGSGELVAKPSIHLVKKILNITKKPDTSKGSILAYWTIEHAIEVSSGGIGGNILLFSLTKQLDGSNSYKISEGKTSEYKSFIEDTYRHIWEYEKGQSSDEIKAIPTL
jgi:hypothetical protein